MMIMHTTTVVRFFGFPGAEEEEDIIGSENHLRAHRRRAASMTGKYMSVAKKSFLALERSGMRRNSTLSHTSEQPRSRAGAANTHEVNPASGGQMARGSMSRLHARARRAVARPVSSVLLHILKPARMYSSRYIQLMARK